MWQRNLTKINLIRKWMLDKKFEGPCPLFLANALAFTFLKILGMIKMISYL